MARLSYREVDSIFHPHSVALVGVTISNPEHWTRTFYNALRKFEFPYPLYLVNPKGSHIDGLKVYPSLTDVPTNVDYVTSTVPAKAAPGLIEECARKGVKTVHFCTAGFRETGEKEGIELEAALVRAGQETGVRIIGPNSMGIYCPESHLSFAADFPRDSGPVALISQSGGNATILVKEAAWRGVRFSKAVSYGNACDLDESDFLEYLAADPKTKIIALYVEGVKDGRKFREAIGAAAEKKTVILLKGGVSPAGARAVASHTGSLAGSEVIWDALCRQLGVIRVQTQEELTDVLVTLTSMPDVKGRSTGIIGFGGGASVLITDQFEKAGLKVPALPHDIQKKIRDFTPIAGNILRNPIDYSQTMMDKEKMLKAVDIVLGWDGIDFLTVFYKPTIAPPSMNIVIRQILDEIFRESKVFSKPMAVVMLLSFIPEEIERFLPLLKKAVGLGLPIYYSFDSAARAINLVLTHKEARRQRPAQGP